MKLLNDQQEKLIEHISDLIRGDWSMTEFDGRDMKRWIDGALKGDKFEMDGIEAKIKEIKSTY